MPKNKGFTLIELLVVIAIMGLLSSIVLVTIDLPAQKQKARIAKSLEFSSSIHGVLGAEAVGIWDFDNNLNDSSGYGNNATCSNCPGYSSDTPYKELGSGQGKYSLSFNGNNNYISVPDTDLLDFGASDFTVSLWFKRISNQSGNGEAPILNKLTTGYIGYELRTGNGYNIGQLILFNGSTKFLYRRASTVPVLGAWYHLTYVVNRKNNIINAYVNGALDNGSGGSSGGFSVSTNISSTQPLWFARSPLTLDNRYGNEMLDEVSIYRQVLSIGQIQQIYTEGLKNHQNLAAK